MNIVELDMDMERLVGILRALPAVQSRRAVVTYDGYTRSVTVEAPSGMAAIQPSAAAGDGLVWPVISFLAQGTTGADVMSMTIDQVSRVELLTETLAALVTAWLTS